MPESGFSFITVLVQNHSVGHVLKTNKKKSTEKDSISNSMAHFSIRIAASDRPTERRD